MKSNKGKARNCNFKITKITMKDKFMMDDPHIVELIEQMIINSITQRKNGNTSNS